MRGRNGVQVKRERIRELKIRLPGEIWDLDEPDALTRLWRDLTGETQRNELRCLARRVNQLERAGKVQTLRKSAADSDVAGAAPEAANERPDLATLERMLGIIKIVQQQTTERLNELAASVAEAAGEGREALNEARSLQDTLAERIAAWEQQLAAFPEQWRTDLDARIDALRETPDAANAALLGVEAFTRSIGSQLREER